MLVVFETLGIQGVNAQQQQLVKYVARSFILFVVPTLTTTIPQVSISYIIITSKLMRGFSLET